MLNYIWFGLLVIGFVVATFNGRIEAVTGAIVDSAKMSIELSIGLLGIMCLWSGLMSIAESSGLVRFISKIARPLLRIAYPEVPQKHPAMAAITLNLVANFLGLGNAATPLGLKAMNELQKLNRFKETSTNSMCMFLVMNTSAIQLIPATIIALRSASGSSNPSEIIGTIWVASTAATIAGIITVRIFMLASKYRLNN